MGSCCSKSSTNSVSKNRSSLEVGNEGDVPFYESEAHHHAHNVMLHVRLSNMVIEENDVWKSCNCFVKVIAKDPSSESGNMEVETETLYCDPNPEFTRVITLSSRVADFVRFEVYHKSQREGKDYDKWIGEYEVELNTLLKCPNYYTAPLYGKDGMCYGSIHICAEKFTNKGHTTDLDVEVSNLLGFREKVYLQIGRVAGNKRIVIGRSNTIDARKETTFHFSNLRDSYLINNHKEGDIYLTMFAENPAARDRYVCHCPISISYYRQAKIGDQYACKIDSDVLISQRKNDLTIIESNGKALQKMHKLCTTDKVKLKACVELGYVSREFEQYSKNPTAKNQYMFTEMYVLSGYTMKEEKPITFTIQNIVSQYTHSFEEFRQYMTFKYMVAVDMSSSVRQEFNSYHNRIQKEIVTPDYDKAILTIGELIRALNYCDDCSLYGISCDMNSASRKLSPIDESSENEEFSPDMKEIPVLQDEESKEDEMNSPSVEPSSIPTRDTDLSNAINDLSESDSSESDSSDKEEEEEKSRNEGKEMGSSVIIANPLTTTTTTTATAAAAAAAAAHNNQEEKQPPAPLQSGSVFDPDYQQKMFKRVQKKLERQFSKMDKRRPTKAKVMKSTCTSNPTPVELATNIRPEHLLKEFRKALKNATPLYPTYLHGTIQKASELAEEAATKNGKEYIVLMIITDGSIVDEVKTLETIAEACNLPLSIVVIGVGGGNFTFFNLLDKRMEDMLAHHHGGVRQELRDITRFVDFSSSLKCIEKLLPNVIDEVPIHVLNYMKDNDITPEQLADGLSEAQD